MNFYIEITLLPGADIDLHYLWSKVYQQIHLALVKIQDDNGSVPVGIALPEYNMKKYQLGSKIRLFASDENNLSKLEIRKWFHRLSDYVHLTQIRPVPKNINKFAMFSRKQANRSQSKFNRTIRRKAEREGISLEEASILLRKTLDCSENDKKKNMNNFNDMKWLKLPYINMKSLSSGERFRLFIIKESGLASIEYEGFNTYGLCHKSSVPDF